MNKMVWKFLAYFVLSIAAWADGTQIKQLFESILTESSDRVAGRRDEILSQLSPEKVNALSTDEMTSVLPLARRCLQSPQLEVRRDGLLLLMAIALRPDSSQLLEAYIDDLDGIIGDTKSPLRQGAVTVLAITRPQASPKAIETLASHLEDKDNPTVVTFAIAGALLKAHVANEAAMVHRVLSVVRRRSDNELTDGILSQLGLIKTRNSEALTFIGENLDSSNPSNGESAVEAVSRLDRETRIRFAAQLGRIAANNSEPQNVRSNAAEALR